MPFAKFAWNFYLVVPDETFLIYYFAIVSPWKSSNPSRNILEFPFQKQCFVPIVIKIHPLVLEKMNSLQLHHLVVFTTDIFDKKSLLDNG